MTESFEPRSTSFDQPKGFPAAPPPELPQPPSPRKDTCDLAIAAMILSLIGVLYGLFCIGFPFAIAGIVCGHIARAKIKKDNLKGNGFALAGLIAGYIVAVLSVLVGAILVLSVFVSGATRGPIQPYSVPAFAEEIDGVGEIPLDSENLEAIE